MASALTMSAENARNVSDVVSVRISVGASKAPTRPPCTTNSSRPCRSTFQRTTGYCSHTVVTSLDVAFSREILYV